MGTWGGKRFRAKAMKAQKIHISLLPLATLVAPILGQLQFNGGVSSSPNSNGNSANRNTNRPTSGDVDEKFFLGGDTPSLTGNQALDGGIVGLGLGALGAAVLGPTIQGALNGGQQSQGYSCGRRKRQANFGGSQASGGQELDGEERFFLPTGQGCTCSNTNGRRRRQAPGEDEPGTRFFGGLFGGQQQHCGSCCFNSQPFNNNNNGFNSNFQNQGFNNQNPGFNNQNQGFNNQNQGFNNQNQNTGRCQCNYSLTFSDQNGNTHGACQRRDNTGRTWCYTTGWNNNCGDLQSSKRHPNNPWSYAACNNQG